MTPPRLGHLKPEGPAIRGSAQPSPHPARTEIGRHWRGRVARHSSHKPFHRPSPGKASCDSACHRMARCLTHRHTGSSVVFFPASGNGARVPPRGPWGGRSGPRRPRPPAQYLTGLRKRHYPRLPHVGQLLGAPRVGNPADPGAAIAGLTTAKSPATRPTSNPSCHRHHYDMPTRGTPPADVSFR